MTGQGVVQRCYEEACVLSLSSGLCRVSALASVLMRYGCSIDDVGALLRAVYRSDIPSDELVDCCNGIVTTPWNVDSRRCRSQMLSEVLESVLSTFRDYPSYVPQLYGRMFSAMPVPDRVSIVSTKGWEFLCVEVDGELVLGVSEYIEDMPASSLSTVVATMLSIPPGNCFHDDLMHHPGFHEMLTWTTTEDYLRSSSAIGGRMLYDPRGVSMPFHVHDVRDYPIVFDNILFAWAHIDTPFTVVPAAGLVHFDPVLDTEDMSKKSMFDLAKILSNVVMCQQYLVKAELHMMGISGLEKELNNLGIDYRLWSVQDEVVFIDPFPVIPPVKGIIQMRQLL